MDEDEEALLEFMRLQQEAEQERARAESDNEGRHLGLAAMNGLLMGFGDEVIGRIRAIGPDRQYETERDMLRDQMESTREVAPILSTVAEVGGAVLPAIATGGGALAARGAATVAKEGVRQAVKRGAAVGAAEGAVYGYGEGEGVRDRLGNIVPGAVGGAVGGAAGGAAGDLLARTLAKYAKEAPATNAAGRVQELLSLTGTTVDDAARHVEGGGVVADINPTLVQQARALRAATAGDGGTESAASILEGLSTRPEEKRREAMMLARNLLSDTPESGNILRDVTSGLERRKTANSSNYERLYSMSPEINDTVSENLETVLEGVRGVRGDLDDFRRAEQLRLELDGAAPVDLRAAEYAMGLGRDEVNSLYEKGKGTKAYQYDALVKSLREALDDLSPELAETRAQRAGIEVDRGAFDAGRRAIKSGNATDVEVMLDDLREESLRYYQEGIMQGLIDRTGNSRPSTVTRNIADENRREGDILAGALRNRPEEDVRGLLDAFTTANRSQDANNRILGGSDTAITLSAQDSVRRLPEMASIQALGAAMDGGIGGVEMGVGILRKVYDRVSRTGEMSQVDLAQMARILTADNVDEFRQMMGLSEGEMRTFLDRAEAARQRWSTGGTVGGGLVGAQTGMGLLDFIYGDD